MSKHRVNIIFMLALLALIACTKVTASEIYHWVDKDGVAHYSQYPPGSDTTNVSQQKMENKAPQNKDEAQDVYNVEAHQKHMAEWREGRDKKRSETHARNQLTTKQNSTEYEVSNNAPINSYWNRPGYGNRPIKPRPPIVRPRPR